MSAAVKSGGTWQTPAGVTPELSVVVKALNEEAKIAQCLQSVVDELQKLAVPAEVILSDSISTDRTVEIAASFPVKVVQFEQLADRGCGAGVQLGYQHAKGRFVFFLDGDMVLQAGFLAAGLAALKAEAGLGGVAGLMVDAEVRNAFDAHRVNAAVSSVAREESVLNGGGLYRREAIEQAGAYAANRNLKGWEEADLGMRVRAAGWRLRRLAVPAVIHDGHQRSTWALLAGMWRSGRAFSSGVLIRQALGQPWLGAVLHHLAHPLATLCWYLLGGLCATFALLSAPGAWTMMGLGPVELWVMASALGFAGLCLLKRGLRPALLSLVLWHYWLLAILRGLFEPLRSPLEPIASRRLYGFDQELGAMGSAQSANPVQAGRADVAQPGAALRR
nr:glycosyltransferase family 2 protein [uncultured Roseateles sp.]